MSEDQQPQKNNNAPDFNQLELDILQYWQQDKTFQRSLEKTKDGQPYVFYDGPPFATGLPHYGHLLASILKDFFGRYYTMHGRYVRRVWGWDCHGLPIENIVEQHLKISGKKQIEAMGVERFNKVCRENVLTYTQEWGKIITRIARWVDFDNSYKTMDTTYMESVWWALKQIWDKGSIYEDRKVLLYCSRCETPISNFEVAMDNSYKDITENSVFVKFKLLPRQRIVDYLTEDKTYVLAWTTTPWTLPGNTALNIGPGIRYVLVEMNGQQYILAKDRLEVLAGQYEIKQEFAARSLEGLGYEPLYPSMIADPDNKAHRIYSEDYVTTTDGTGIVHNAAMYGEEDYEAAKRRGLPRQHILDNKGQYLDAAPASLRGQFFKDADKIVLEELTSRGLVFKVVPYTHSYPHCYRCGTPLFYNALPAWFISIQKIKSELLANNEKINWYPEHLKYGRFAKSIESAPDWNISRNRYWATALPFWKCENKECKNVVCLGSVEELREKSINFAEVYPTYNLQPTTYNLAELDLHKPYIDQIVLQCEHCQSQMHRVPEVIDCWVESASMPFAELHAPFENQELFKQRFPADFVAEYIGQTRAWYYVMHVMGTFIKGDRPFKNVVTTGNILAEDGQKMSKSKKNFPDPLILIDKYGVDPIRMYLLTSSVIVGEDVNFSDKSVVEVSRKVNMLLYNVWSFYRMYEKGMVADGMPTATHVLDTWMLEKLKELQIEVSRDLDNYNTVRAGKMLVEFINDLSTWYLRRSRDRLKAGGDTAKQAASVLGYVLVELSKLLAPFMPFLAEHIFRNLTGKDSVHLQDWPQTEGLVVDKALLLSMDIVREAASVGNAARKELGKAVRQPLRALAIKVKSSDAELSDELLQLLLEELNVKAVDQTLADSALSQVTTHEGTNHVKNLYLDLTITPELKREGLARELERQVQDLRKKSGLKVGELVDVYYNTQDQELEDALLNLLDRKKTFVNQISKSLEVEVEFEIQATVDGQAIWLGIAKI